MKFLHLADLHIGKRLEGRLRLDEQRAVLEEIVEIARAEKVDLALIAGDVFDVASPSAEAKRVFYRFALDLASLCPVIAISGNHDSSADLSAPSEIAEVADIRLIGQCTALSLVIAGEKLNLSAVPYPDDAVLRSFEGEYTDKVRALIAQYTSHFVSGENNILLSHLFMTGGAEGSDENTLGPARMLPKTVLPENCYSALGHVHKPMTVSASRKAYYSGSPLAYHFDDEGEKSVIICEMTSGQIANFRRIPLRAGKKLVVEEVTDVPSAITALERNAGNLVKLRLYSDEPLSVSETKTLRAHESFIKLEPITSVKTISSEGVSVKTRTDAELFEAYYESYYKEKPPKEIATLFADILAEAKGEK
ncbi:MAG: exonuclease subunit SbcD [Clostridia bacterium]|nr:exonuclease subunit SbcD [Clostridia bacterium]